MAGWYKHTLNAPVFIILRPQGSHPCTVCPPSKMQQNKLFGVPRSKIPRGANLGYLLGNEKCLGGRPQSWNAGCARRGRAPESCWLLLYIKACCVQVPTGDALSSQLLLDSLYISSPNKSMFHLLSPGLFFSFPGPPSIPGLQSAGMQLHNHPEEKGIPKRGTSISKGWRSETARFTACYWKFLFQAFVFGCQRLELKAQTHTVTARVGRGMATIPGPCFSGFLHSSGIMSPHFT